MDMSAAYEQVQERLVDAVLAAGEAATSTMVPASPAWSVRDVVGHVAGLAADAASGAVPGLNLLESWRDDSIAAARDEMTERQVAARRGEALAAVIAQWQAVTSGMRGMLRGETPFPGRPPAALEAVLVTDLAIHEQDVRAALGLARPPDGPATAVALAAYCFGVDYRIRQLKLPALDVRYAGKERRLGEGDPAAAVEADRYELVRALAGRRSRDQIRALAWDGDPEEYLALIPAYGERSQPLTD